MKSYEVIIVGSGAMGSAITYHLAKRGVSTLTLERFALNHTNGSSHGKSRIIRTAYYEHTSYVPLVKRAFDLWLQLQDESGIELLRMTGGLMFGMPDSELVSGAIKSAQQHNLRYELLSAREIRERYEVFRPSDDEVAVFEPNAGVLFPERCIQAHVALARNAGSEFRFNEPLQRWQYDGDRILARTAKETYFADTIIFASGSWITELLANLELLLQCERQTPFWFRPIRDQELFSAAKMPIFMWQEKNGDHYYGTPDTGEGLKVARHHGGQIAPPDKIRREVTHEEEFDVRAFLERRIPSANGELLSSTTCLYTNSPDGHFIIDFHPEYRNVLIVSACSGHGFKFATVAGEIVSEMALKGRTKHDISLFSLKRFRGESI